MVEVLEKTVKEGQRYWAGLDVGKLRDFTAMCIVTRRFEPDGPTEIVMRAPLDEGFYTWNSRIRCIRQPVKTIYEVVYMDRPPLKTEYEVIAERVAERLCAAEPNLPFRDRKPIGLIVDATGVGNPVWERIKTIIGERKDAPKTRIEPATITGGTRSRWVPGDGWKIPRKELISTTQMLVRADKKKNRLFFASRFKDTDALIEELRNFTWDSKGRSTLDDIEWRRDGAAHDDQIFAMALAVWRWEQTPVDAIDVPMKDQYTGPRSPLTGTPIGDFPNLPREVVYGRQ